MPEIKVFDMTGKEVDTMTLSEKVFSYRKTNGERVKEATLHAAVRAYLMNQRQGTQSTLTRTEVSGGGKKPWRQKGTGRARQGSTRAPQWTHGGIALGPKPRDYRVTLNKKVRISAILGAITAKFEAGEIIVVDEIKLENYSTKAITAMLKALGCEKDVTKTYKVKTVLNRDENGMATEVNLEKKTRTATVAEKALVVLGEVDEKVAKSCANISGVETTLSSTINVYEVLKADKVIMTRAAVEKLEEVYA